MKVKNNIRVGISIGDINGIGGEIVLKTFEDSRMLEFCTPVIFASNKVIAFQKKHFGLEINYNGVQEASQVVDGKVNIVNISKNAPKIEFGKETPEAGKYALLSLKAAVEALKADEVDVLVTAPINKHNIQSEEFHFPGHTDYLAEELGGEALMFMVTEDLKVGLMTDHIAVKDVSENITRDLILKKTGKIHDSLVRDFRIRKPRIAVLGINPHSGDNGVIGKEDDTVLKPVIKELFEMGMMVFGPYSADSFFGSENYKKFDAILAAYHDQGLIPFKTLSFGKGVNYTAGLDRVRTSPDHGTAYEIAGKGTADFQSFKEAVFTALHIYRNREEYKKISANPLKKSSVNTK
ncbi:4-hydroxythreonine-4-phosphate dehydrogenase PdxA [Sinomicrobium weinanense]|uniref:4-hydroxythreonine-4-phosphate dehydrogenase PdxA n=1 Tax=Sinomicrobium weinanense TaxID=2842200 RepID=A0A926Q074_9FLAO|nr:4-hydroxythreonine-4-phosphate dehydrogenase PdxA [Sinomicrobium weinanense]MBC9794603.1 4-hydroxythreonine-4-phosphate dehydrogenase PdxA [Sinomicrobium weinanense]MBU3124088.1 4-hydroxythreonine-4-phosphate dehydrogenase PdxA [Sinomicrobium weinanense]